MDVRGPKAWWQDRAVDDLYVYAPPLVALKIGGIADMEQVAELLVHGGPRVFASADPRIPPDTRPPKTYWQSVKAEFYVLCCTDEARYNDLRAKLHASADKSNAVVIPLIAAALTAQLGFAAGAITGLVAVALTTLVKIGKEAFCQHCRQHFMPPQPNKSDESD